jgi:hypothetical protein
MATQELTVIGKGGDVALEIERVLMTGDLGKLTAEQRVVYYNAVCKSIGLNPLTRPFDYLNLNNKLVLYARKDATEQLRNMRGISLQIASREVIEGVYVVTATATMKTTLGIRTDEATGAVAIENLKGDAKANAMMKAETKAKRRVTLSICGLGMLDETEVETIPDARPEPPRETQKQVAERRIAEEREREAGAAAAKKAASAVASAPPAPPAEPGRQTPTLPPQSVQELWRRMTSIASICAAFAELKHNLAAIAGADNEYYRILAQHGMEHANDCAKIGMKAARLCARELLETLERWEAKNLEPSPNPEAEITDEDVPF